MRRRHADELASLERRALATRGETEQARMALVADFEAAQARIEARSETLGRIGELVQGAAETSGVPLLATLSATVLSILGVGAVADKKRADAVIAAQKSNIEGLRAYASGLRVPQAKAGA